MKNLYKLKLVGITYNQIESGVYALILEHEESQRRLPIIIGYPEAQAIECKLQEVVTPRPLTHDLMVSMMDVFGITLKSVVIRRLSNGVFAADLTLENGETHRVVDSRSSDAVALAIRVGAPIYTTGEVLDEAAISPRGAAVQKSDEMKQDTHTPQPLSLEEMDLTQLEHAMRQAVDKENYEEAARIKDEIERRK